MQTELPEVARPTEPKVWRQVNSFTIAFGHGVSTTPFGRAVKVIVCLGAISLSSYDVANASA